jgi:aminoglycoside phosphotransferase family enzyme
MPLPPAPLPLVPSENKTGVAPASDETPDKGLPTLQAKRQFLSSLAAHPGLRRRPTSVQTHMSWLFFAGEVVLKLKKPVRFPFLDFTTLAAREYFCREELRLNSRLAPDVYLGLSVLQSSATGLSLVAEEDLQLDRRTVDWLVRMRRLPQRRNLRQLIAKGRARPADVEAIANVLAEFYRRVPRVKVRPAEYLARFERELAVDREVLLRPQFRLRDAGRALDRFDDLLAGSADLLQQRAGEDRLVDGHGDLRPEHVYLTAPPVIIDCLEFNAELRQVDPFDELAFLGLECSVAGAPWVAPQLADACAASLGLSPPPAPLIRLYTAHRALLRARLAMAHLLDPRPRTPRKWPAQAQAYLDAAAAALDEAHDTPALSAAMNRGTP